MEKIKSKTIGLFIMSFLTGILMTILVIGVGCAINHNTRLHLTSLDVICIAASMSLGFIITMSTAIYHQLARVANALEHQNDLNRPRLSEYVKDVDYHGDNQD